MKTATRLHEHIVSDGIGSAPVDFQLESPQKENNETVTRCETFTTLSITALLLPETAFF